MSAIHELIHDVVREWSFFAGLAALLAAAAVAGALALASRGARRLSSRSRYGLVAVALLAPVLGLLLIPIAAGGWADLVRFPEQPPAVTAEGAVDMEMQLLPAASGEAGLDARCLVALVWGTAFLLMASWRLGEWVRWRRVATLAPALADARLLELFRRSWKGRGAPPEVRTDPTCEEPMVVGLVRPVILLPFGYGEMMEDGEIETVAVHELEHVMRRDNLTAALADLLASLFWFDPFHWIARRRLLELREGACDERVLARGLPARAYLSALAKTSHAGFESPAVACMSGFRIRERMESIMTYATNHPRWISERSVGVASVVAVALIALAIAGFAPAAAAEAASSEPGQTLMGEHSVVFRMSPAADGFIDMEAVIRKGNGTIVKMGAQTRPGQTADVATIVSGLTYRLSVTPAGDGSGFAKLEVLDGDKLIDTVVKSIEAPRATMRKPAEKINLHLAGADLRDFTKTLSQLTGVPIHVAPTAEGKITIDVKDTPWDEALAKAIAPLGLRYGTGDEGIFIVPHRVMELQPAPPGYHRVGGEIQPPKVLTRIAPIYTPEARKARVAGIVLVEALIGEDGLVRDAKILKALPFGLDQAALDAIRQWTFAPAMLDGKPVGVVFNLSVNFKLDAEKEAEEKQ